MRARPRPPAGYRAGAADAIGQIDAADASTVDIDPQALRHLTWQVDRQRQRHCERVAALRAAYSALARAIELDPRTAPGLVDQAAMFALFELAEARADLAGLREFARFAGPWSEP